MAGSLQGRCRLKEPLAATSMAKSGCGYASGAPNRPETDERKALREAVAKAFGDSGRTCGCRRLLPEASSMDGIEAGEWAVRKIMREEVLAARNPKKERRHSSYAGDVSEASGNTCLDDAGRHRFDADGPNGLRATGIAGFRIPADKCSLSPVTGCSDGMPIGVLPTAELANSSLLQACSQPREGERPRGCSDRGGHHRWPGRTGICNDCGIVRSMPRKGRSPGNSRMEGFFGRLKAELFYGRGWQGVAMDEFMGMLDGYMVWYRDRRRKSDLGYVSPMQYRKNLGPAAWDVFGPRFPLQTQPATPRLSNTTTRFR